MVIQEITVYIMNHILVNQVLVLMCMNHRMWVIRLLIILFQMLMTLLLRQGNTNEKCYNWFTVVPLKESKWIIDHG